MQQEMVWELLNNAARRGCGRAERAAIIRDLEQAIPLPINDSRKVGFDSLLPHLFWGTIAVCPAFLLVLFPVFAAICGDRTARGDAVAPINWKLFRKMLGPWKLVRILWGLIRQAR